MASTALPSREDEVADAIADAARDGDPLTIVGGNSKREIGAPVEARVLAMRGMAGVVDYDPAELVLTTRPGTPLADIQALVEGERQMLAFEPFDHGLMFGRAVGTATIGGIVAAGVSGSQRVSAGGVRDHLLGFRAVSGRGEMFVAGAKVVKNVTGYDLPKLAAGSWGRLFAMTELTLKVLPRPRVAVTRVIEGLGDAQAVAAMSAAMGSQAEIAASAHCPAALRGGRSLTAFRLQGFGPSVAARGAILDRLFATARVETLGETEAAAFWDDFRTLAPLGRERALWRINVPPSAAPGMLGALHALEATWLLDWAGGLVWLALDGEVATVRTLARDAGGHATLVRASVATRRTVPAFHPPAAGIAALEQRVRRAFDPHGVFETGRF